MNDEHERSAQGKQIAVVFRRSVVPGLDILEIGRTDRKAIGGIALEATPR
jgi:hypothetical protein